MAETVRLVRVAGSFTGYKWVGCGVAGHTHTTRANVFYCRKRVPAVGASIEAMARMEAK